MAIAGYWLPALRRCLLGVVLLSLFLPLCGAGQPRQLSHQLAWVSAAQLIDQTRLPTRLLNTELLAAEALGYAAGTDKSRSRAAQPRTGSWWAWLSTAVLALVLLRVGIALHAARRFNRELATQVGSLLGYLYYLSPAPASVPHSLAAPAPTPVAPSLAVPPEPIVPLVTVPTPPAPLKLETIPPELAAPPQQQQQALHELRQAAEAALDDADFGPAQLAELLALGERTLYRHVKEVAGLTPAAYLRELRLQHAHQLLATQACPSVAEVAYQSGFNDPSYFGQVFQKRFGKKPSAYL